MTPGSVRGWLTDIVLGTVVGCVVGAIAAVNLVIYLGTDEGYEASIGEVFEHNKLVGLLAVASLVGSPLVAIAVARRIRARRSETLGR